MSADSGLLEVRWPDESVRAVSSSWMNCCRFSFRCDVSAASCPRNGDPVARTSNPARQHGVTLSQIVERRLTVPELQRASLVIRAQSYRRRLFAEIEKAKGLLLP